MASKSGSKDPFVSTSRVEEQLFSEPYSFEFVQAVRLLCDFYPMRAVVGHFEHPQSEVVRFGVRPSLAFPASEVHELTSRTKTPPLMRVNFMGTVGPLGVLPLYYTELAAERLMNRDSTLMDFLDIFHHRIISLFFRAWQKHRFLVGFEQRKADEFSHYLLDIIGLGTPGLQNRQRVEDYSLLFYAGLLAQHPRSAEGLELMLRDYFGVPVQVEQFLGGWYRLAESEQCSLDETTWECQKLGFGSVVGDEIWNQQARVRVVLGPLPLKQYLDFLPSGSAHEPLRQLVRFYAGDEFDFEAQLILKREDAPACELGGTGLGAPQLGWVSWSKTRELETNASQTILQL